MKMRSSACAPQQQHSQNTAVPLPPFHPDLLKGSPGDAPTAASRRARSSAAAQQLFTDDGNHVVTVPAAAVAHIPRSGVHVQCLTLCRSFHDEHGRPGMCPRGDRCKFVHVNLPAAALDALPRNAVHVAYSSRNLDAVPYPRHASGSAIVALPGIREPKNVTYVDAGYLIATRALDIAPRDGNGVIRARLCRDFMLRRVCPRGSCCDFAHVAHVSDRAQPRQRAPVRDAIAASDVGSTGSPRSAVGVASEQLATPTPSSVPSTGTGRDGPLVAVVNASQQCTPAGAAASGFGATATSAFVGGSASQSDADVQRGWSSGASSSRPPTARSRDGYGATSSLATSPDSVRSYPFRHNPYAARPTRVSEI